VDAIKKGLTMIEIKFRAVITVFKDENGDWIANAEATNKRDNISCTEKASKAEASMYTNKRSFIQVLVHRLMNQIMD